LGDQKGNFCQGPHLPFLGCAGESKGCLFNAGKVETLDELVKVTGGTAAELGYRFSDEEILAYYNNQEALLKLRSDSIAQGLSDIKDMMIAGASSGCGARQIMMEPHCRNGHYR